jgi:hypothetical protein
MLIVKQILTLMSSLGEKGVEASNEELAHVAFVIVTEPNETEVV